MTPRGFKRNRPLILLDGSKESDASPRAPIDLHNTDGRIRISPYILDERKNDQHCVVARVLDEGNDRVRILPCVLDERHESYRVAICALAEGKKRPRPTTGKLEKRNKRISVATCELDQSNQ